MKCNVELTRTVQCVFLSDLVWIYPSMRDRSTPHLTDSLSALPHLGIRIATPLSAAQFGGKVSQQPLNVTLLSLTINILHLLR